jgi:hypothetical protein
MALSKSDLLPNLNVFNFRDLLIDKACDDIDELRRVLAGLVKASDALSVGEDFMLLSSAKFDAGKIEVTKRIGLDLILPLAAMLPFERHLRWAQMIQLPTRVAENLLGGAAGVLVTALIGRRLKLLGRAALLLGLVDPKFVSHAAKLAGDKLREINSEALAKQDFLTAALTRFRMDLDKGEQEKILLRSRR